MIDGVGAGAWRALVAACEAAWPREACGWLSGEAAAAPDLHSATPGSADAFAFTDDDLLRLAAAYRQGPAPRLLYHSHPDGLARLSAADRAALAPAGVLLHPLPHLVVAVDAGRATAAALYRWRDGAPVRTQAVVRDAGGDWRPEPAP